jgi:predicted Zn-dependent peptidase
MIKLHEPRRIALGSGATLICQGNPVSPTTAFGIWIGRGSRDEAPGERGLSHILEHMVFRGTSRRSALDTALELERIGGAWDAFTSKESTCFHGRTLEEHFPVLADIFSDIVLHPLVPAEALRTELKVIREEIRSVKDSPEESTYELFYRKLFDGSQLGHPVAGGLRDISGVTRDGVRRFHRKTYTASNTLIGFVGNTASDEVARLVDGLFDFPRGGRVRRQPAEVFSGRRRHTARRPQWGQTHVCTGTRTVPASDPSRFAVMLLSNIVGGGISSRMFQSMRERAGLAYSVFSSVNFWRDTGAISVYFSVEPRNLGKALDLFGREIDVLLHGGVREEELESAKAQLKGSIVLGLESTDARLFRLLSNEFYHGGFRDIRSVLRDIDAVTIGQVDEAAGRYLSPAVLTRVINGPVRSRSTGKRGDHASKGY